MCLVYRRWHADPTDIPITRARLREEPCGPELLGVTVFRIQTSASSRSHGHVNISRKTAQRGRARRANSSAA